MSRRFIGGTFQIEQEATEETESFFPSPFASFPPVKFWSSVLLEREDPFPIVLHADPRPAVSF